MSRPASRAAWRSTAAGASRSTRRHRRRPRVRERAVRRRRRPPAVRAERRPHHRQGGRALLRGLGRLVPHDVPRPARRPLRAALRVGQPQGRRLDRRARVGGHTGVYLPFEVRARARRRPHPHARRPRRLARPRPDEGQGLAPRLVQLRRHQPRGHDPPGRRPGGRRAAPSHDALRPAAPRRVEVSARLRDRAARRASRPRDGHAAPRRAGDRAALPAGHRPARRAAPGPRHRRRCRDAALWAPGRPSSTTSSCASASGPRGAGASACASCAATARRMLLNGEQLKLHGASLHEDAPGHGDGLRPRRAWTSSSRELTRIGANATRAQHPLSPSLLEKLDARGDPRLARRRPGRRARARGPRAARGSSRRPGPRAPVGRPAADAPVDLRLEPRQRGRRPGPPRRAGARTSTRWRASCTAATPAASSASTSGARTRRSAPARCTRDIDAIGYTNYLGWYEQPYATPAELEQLIRTKVAELQRRLPRQGRCSSPSSAPRATRATRPTRPAATRSRPACCAPTSARTPHPGPERDARLEPARLRGRPELRRRVDPRDRRRHRARARPEREGPAHLHRRAEAGRAAPCAASSSASGAKVTLIPVRARCWITHRKRAGTARRRWSNPEGQTMSPNARTRSPVVHRSSGRGRRLCSPPRRSPPRRPAAPA